MDLVVSLDLTSGEAELLKVGAVASYIKSGDEGKRGRFGYAAFGYSAGDKGRPAKRKTGGWGPFVVMVTDGMVELSPETGENWLLGALRGGEAPPSPDRGGQADRRGLLPLAQGH